MITAQEARQKTEEVERTRLMAIIEKYVTQASNRGEYFAIIEEVLWPVHKFLADELKEKGFTLQSYKKTNQFDCGGFDVLKISWA